jgi:hypothetical protein
MKLELDVCNVVELVVKDLLARGMQVAIPFPSSENYDLLCCGSDGEWRTVKVQVIDKLSEIKVYDFRDMHRNEKEELLREYLREGRWQMLDDKWDLPTSPRLTAMLEETDNDPAVFIQGDVNDEAITKALDDFYKDDLDAYEKEMTDEEV